MPGKEVEDGIHNLYELENSSQNQHLLQAVGGNWPVSDYNQWTGKPTQIGGPPSLNRKNYNLQPLDSVKEHHVGSLHMPHNHNYTQLTPRSEYSRSLSIKNLLNANESLLGCQNQLGIFCESTCNDQRILSSRGFSIFKSQPENECADSPTLTTNSERSEITEASGDCNFLRGQQQFVRDQELNAPQPHPMQQPGYNDMQLWQQHMMFKQLQEFQRQQQLGDLRQQNPLNQFSAISRQAAGGQFSPFINGTPVNDSSQTLRNWMQRSASPVAQGASNKVVFSQEQGHALLSMGLTPQQLDVSLYGTPITNTRGNVSQYPHIQGLSHDSVNLLAKAGGQTQKLIMQSSGFGNVGLGDQHSVPDLVGLPQGALTSKQEVQMKSNFGLLPVQGPYSGIFLGNLQEGNTPNVNTSLKEFNGRQEQGGSPAIQQAKQFGSSQGMVPLDPMEAKILYNMDSNIWDAFGSRPDTGAGGFGNTMENPDSSYPSIQSGSWSALMQSAVAEASSSDTGLQEEWSGLTFQNTEHSTDNQISNFVDSERQQTGWVDNNLQTASSLSSKHFSKITDSSVSPTFPGFHQPGVQLSVEQREDICKDRSHESAVNYNPQRPAVQDGEKDQTFNHSNNAWSRQMFEHSQGAAQHKKGASTDISTDKGSESMVRSQRQMSNGPHIAVNSYEGENETHEKQQNYEEREKSSDCLKGSSSHEQGHFGHSKPFGNSSSSAIHIDKASIPDPHGSQRTSEEVPSKGDHGSNALATFHGSLLPDGSNVTSQTSEHMLELLNKVDQSSEYSTLKQFGSVDCSSLADMHGADSRDTSIAQMYSQSSASQGFGLRLAPPSQWLGNSNSVLLPVAFQQAVNNLNSRQVNAELGEKSQAQFMPSSSFHPSPPSHELAQRPQWENKSGMPSHTSFSPFVNMQGNSVSPFSPNRPQTSRQFQVHPSSGVSVTSQSSQASLPGIPSRFPPFNQVPNQDTSHSMHSNANNQQFPVLDTLPVSQPSNMSSTSQQGQNFARPYNVWRNVPTQREPQKFNNLPSTIEPTNNRMSSISWASQASNDQNHIKGGFKSSDPGASFNSQGCDRREELPGKEIFQQCISSDIHNSSSGGASKGQEPFLDANALTSSSLGSHAQQQDVDKIRHSDSLSQSASRRNLDSFSHLRNDNHNYALLHQVHAMNSADNALEVQSAAHLEGQQLQENVSRFGHPLDGRPSSISQPSFPSGDAQILGFSAEARDGPALNSPLLAASQSRHEEMVAAGSNDSHTQSTSSSVLSNHTEQGHVNLHMSHSWFKQYGTLRNGQMLPVFDSRLAKAATSQFSLGMPSQNLHIQPPLERLDATGAGQGSRVWPNAALVGGQQLLSPYMLPSEATNQMSVMRPKKRKIMEIELIPWHKEVMHNSRRLQSISVAEQDWAQATNRLIEKVEDEVEMTEDLQPIHRSKRRLILTTQLVQQLFRPPSASILSADSASNSDIVSYFVSRLSLGDACSLAYCMLKDNIDSEQPKISQQLLEVVENFIDITKKLENDLQRLDKTASVAGIRAELQELERVAVINRFARFHVRGQMDASGTSSSFDVPKPVPQRYITAIPMPRNLPEGVQCLSL